MAAKKHQVENTNKRKRTNTDSHESPSNSKNPKFALSKKPKPFTKDSNSKNPKFDASKKFKPDSFSNEKKDSTPLTGRERRIQSKELSDARKKKRKRHFTLEQELVRLWEKMRRHEIAKEDRAKLVTEALQKMKGKIHEIAGSHVSSHVLQSCVKHCSQAERDEVFEELRPHFLTLAYNAYAVHLVKKMLDNASKKQLTSFISTLRGHVAPLLRHMVGSVVVEHAYELASAAQKQELLLELYSTELQLFKDLVTSKESRLQDVMSKLGLQKGSVLRHMSSVIQPILEKGIVDHSILHRILLEYFSIADQRKRQKAKETQSKNTFYHTTSRGGYRLVKEKWKNKYVEAKRGELGDTEDVIEAPSPPRHELFKLAHERKIGSFTTDQSASVASKIVAKQNDAKSCGYYVMINMMTIVSATITNNWKKVFNASDPFTSEELKHIRKVWAEFFLKLYQERKPVGKEERRKTRKGMC